MQKIEETLNKFTIGQRPLNEFHETCKEVAEFMEEPTLLGKWKSRLKGIKPNQIRDLIKQSKQEGNPPQKLFNFLIKK